MSRVVQISSSIAVILLLVAACGRSPEMQPTLAKGSSVDPLGDIQLWQECSRDQASKYGPGNDDGKALIKAASCFAILAEDGSNGKFQLEDAQNGRVLAEMAVKKYPNSGVARYMLAYLTALEAEHDPVRGLQLVPVIEAQAKQAASLNPGVDYGGADRLLGELYLRAPEFPVSVGDTSKAVIHYRRAYTLDPDFSENHLGLVEALLSDGDQQEACRELKNFYVLRTETLNEKVRQRSLDLFQRVCELIGQNE